MASLAVGPLPSQSPAPAETGTVTPQHVPGHEQFRADLVAGRSAICVWGLGYIGWSTADALRAEGVRVVGYDVNVERVAALRAALPTPGRLALTSDRRSTLQDDVAVHFVAVPTERDAEPYADALTDVLSSIVAATARQRAGRAPLVIIESTLTPGTVKEILLPMIERAGLIPDSDLLLALAPRRDWFLAEGYGLRDVDRVYCGVGPRSAQAAFSVLSLMCDTLHQATSHIEGELVKCVENAFRHLEITLANQLSLGYPQVDMVEVLRLAGTKWNVGTFHPSFGTGGYCIPLSSRYLLRGAQEVHELSLLSQAVETDMRMRTLVADAIAGRGPVLILGLAYKGGIKVATLSPTVRISEELRSRGVDYSVHDPLYTQTEIEHILGAGSATTDLVASIRAANTVLIVPDHPEFRGDLYVRLLTEERTTPLLILDNHGVLADCRWPAHVTYRRAGHPEWLTIPEHRREDAE